MTTSETDASDDAINWPAVAALYAGLSFGLCLMLYWGEYRNAAWLGLIGAGGGCSAYGRLLDAWGRSTAARWWHRGGALFYAAFFVWGGYVLLQTL